MTAPVSATSVTSATPIQGKGVTEGDRNVGLRLSTIRKARGLSQTALGKAIGVTFQQVQKYEKGQNRIGAGRLQTIARFLEVPLSDLYGEEGTQGTDEAFAFLNEPGAIELLRLYAGIENADTRRSVLTIVRAAAKIGAAMPEEEA